MNALILLIEHLLFLSKNQNPDNGAPNFHTLRFSNEVRKGWGIPNKIFSQLRQNVLVMMPNATARVKKPRHHCFHLLENGILLPNTKESYTALLL